MARKSKKPKPMAELLNSTSGTLSQITTKTNSLKKIATIVRQICPDLPEQAWHIGNIRENIVVIEVISSVWGQRLQFERNKITQQLGLESDNRLNQVEIKVNPYFNRKEKSNDDITKPSKYMSPKTAEQLLEVAENAPTSLQEKIRKLAEHAKK